MNHPLCSRLRWTAALGAILLVATASLPWLSPRDGPGVLAAAPGPTVSEPRAPRLFDPKLQDASAPIRYKLGPVGATAQVTITVERRGVVLATVFDGPEQGANSTITHHWDGRQTSGKFVDPGDCKVRILAKSSGQAEARLDMTIVRLGITAIAAVAAGAGEELQMVYYKVGTATTFTLTDASHEYVNQKRTGETSDLDQDDGSPRPAVAIHEPLDTPPMNGTSLETRRFNEPLCYTAGSVPRLHVTFGAKATSSAGGATDCGYPVTGYSIRCKAEDDVLGDWEGNDATVPSGVATFDGPALPQACRRTDLTMTWTWELLKDGTSDWKPIPGMLRTPLRFYTVLGDPAFAGMAGVQHVGPWVKVASLLDTWRIQQGGSCVSNADLIRIVVKGFFEHSGLTFASGSSYYDLSTNSVALSAFLDGRTEGDYANCSDVAALVAGMLSMLGVPDLQLQHIEDMEYKMIQPLGVGDFEADDSFIFHHVATRDGGTRIIDASLGVDVDGDSTSPPGTLGLNGNRRWAGGTGYKALAIYQHGSISWTARPGLE